MEPAAPAAPVEPAAPSSATLAYAVPVSEAAGTCYRCGYVLHGIADDQPCPECGLLAERSRRATDELHDTRPRWLARIARGANLVLLSILLAAAAPIVISLVQDAIWRLAIGPNRTMLFRLVQQAPLIAVDLAAAVLLVGVFMLTAREGYAPADDADHRLRRALRVAAAVPLVVLALNHAQIELTLAAFTVPNWTPGYGQAALGVVAAFLGTVGLAPLPLLFFRHLRGLAKRARSAHLAEHCTIVGVGAALSFVYLGVVAFVGAYGRSMGLSHNFINRSNVWLGMMLLMGVSAFLFLLWSLYLLIRFAIAFNRASRQLRGKWTQADRSVVTGLR